MSNAGDSQNPSGLSPAFAGANVPPPPLLSVVGNPQDPGGTPNVGIPPTPVSVPRPGIPPSGASGSRDAPTGSAEPIAQTPELQMQLPPTEDEKEARRLQEEAEQAARESAKAASDEMKVRAKETGRQADAINANSNAEIRKNGALQGVYNKQANDAQLVQTAQQDYLKKFNKTAADAQVYSDSYRQQLEAFIAKNHVTDFWSAVGVNPIQGRIAAALGGIGAGINGGQNAPLEYFKSLAADRATQIAREGAALAQKGGAVHAMYTQGAQVLESQQAAQQHIESAGLKSIAAMVQQVSNRYKNPQTQAQAQGLVGQLKAEAAQKDLQAKQEVVKTKLGALQAKTNVFDHLVAAHEKLNKQTTEDKVEKRKILEGAAATDQAVGLLHELKKTNNPARRKQLQAELAPILAKADVPGSNRILTHEGRQSELEKLGGFKVPFTDIHYGGDYDGLEETLLQQQEERDHQFGTNTAAEIRKKYTTPEKEIAKLPEATR